MKKPVLIGVSALVLLASATLLFAQTTTGSSLITEMKAGLRDFTLAGQLNPGVSDLKSAPVGGKKTGDMLTAGEYNRILELVGQGGGGGSGGSGWVDVPTTDTADFDMSCIYRMTATGTDIAGGSNMRYAVGVQAGQLFFGFNLNPGWIGGYIAKGTKATFSTNSNGTYTVNKLEKFCGGSGGGGGGSGWVDVSSTTTPFDVNCEYKWKVPNFVPNGAPARAESFLASRVSGDIIQVDFSAGNYQSVSASNKRSSTGDHGTFAAQTFQRCDGVGGGTTPPPAAPVTQAISVTTAADYNVSATVSCPSGYRLDASTITDSAPFNLGTPLGSGRVTLSGQGLICKSFMVGGGHGGTWTANTCSATCNK